jgi:hypothetical protein
MKFLRVTITSTKEVPMVYPDKCEENIGRFSKDFLYYGDNGVCKLLLLIEDKDYNEATMLVKYVELISEAEAKVISEANEQRLTYWKDPTQAELLKLKVDASIALTTAEAAKLDSASPDYLAATTKILADRIDDHKATEVAITPIIEEPIQ